MSSFNLDDSSGLYIPASTSGDAAAGDFGDLAFVDYQDLVPALQKDLQLDASTDLLPGTVQEALIAPTTGYSIFPQLLSSHKIIIDDNGGSLYSVTFTNVPATSFLQHTFTTVYSQWSVAVPLGSLAFSTGGVAQMMWTYGFVSPNTFGLTVTNNAGVQQTCTWIGVVIGR